MHGRTIILAIRHGESEYNADGRIQGQSDVPLSMTGRGQAYLLAQRLACLPIAAVISSDLRRAWQTAIPLADRLGAPLTKMATLRERAAGTLEGKTLAEIEADSPHEKTLWETQPEGYAPPGGESRGEVQRRVMVAIGAITQAYPNQIVAVVTHQGPLDVLYRTANKLGLTGPSPWKVPNTSIGIVTVDADIQVQAWGKQEVFSDVFKHKLCL